MGSKMREKEIKGIFLKSSYGFKSSRNVTTLEIANGIQILPFPTAPHKLTPMKLEIPILV